MPHRTKTLATAEWVSVPWTELPGDFSEPIYFKVGKRENDKVSIQLLRGERIKRLTLKDLDRSTVLQKLVTEAKAWDEKLKS